jgi:hypothetical protein
MKKVLFVSQSVPDRLGYNDKVTVTDENQTILFHGPCSVCPNPFKVVKDDNGVPIDHIPYEQAYGWLDAQTIMGECVLHQGHEFNGQGYGKCLLLNDGGPCKSRIPDVNNDNKYIVRSVFCHHGESELWRGSAGCATLAPSLFPSFIALFAEDERCEVSIIIAEGFTIG